MEFANRALLEAHKKLIDAFSEESAMFIDCVISMHDVLNAHFSIVDFFLENRNEVKNVENIGAIDTELLSSAVGMQIVERSGKFKWKTDYEKCSALFYGLIKYHPFQTCNKRTALLAVLYYLAKLNRQPSAHHKELEILTRIIASNTIRDRQAFKPYSKFEDGEIRYLSQYFENNTRAIDKRYYVITYRELNNKLSEFGFCLNNPQGNSIDIVRIAKRSPLFKLLKILKGHTKVGVIGFPGWTREVSIKEMTLVSQYTGITEQDGLKSQIVYKNEPPLSSLINAYRDVLERLAKK